MHPAFWTVRVAHDARSSSKIYVQGNTNAVFVLKVVFVTFFKEMQGFSSIEEWWLALTESYEMERWIVSEREWGEDTSEVMPETNTHILTLRIESRSQKKFDHSSKKRWKPFKEPRRRPISTNSAASDKKSKVKTSRRHRPNRRWDVESVVDFDNGPDDLDQKDPMYPEESWDSWTPCDCLYGYNRPSSLEEALGMFVEYHGTNWRLLLPDCLERWVRYREGKVHPMSDNENEEEQPKDPEGPFTDPDMSTSSGPASTQVCTIS